VAKTQFVHDGWNMVAEFDATTTPTLMRLYAGWGGRRGLACRDDAGDGALHAGDAGGEPDAPESGAENEANAADSGPIGYRRALTIPHCHYSMAEPCRKGDLIGPAGSLTTLTDIGGPYASLQRVEPCK
jgi:hypothetical protein